MIFTYLTFLAALSVAGVAEWFSVVGIMSIYAAAPYHAGLIMGLVLGFAKLVTVSWLYRNWAFSDWKVKGPLVYFTLALMLATSMGVFGFLTKAHLEQGASTVDNSAKVERLDQQIAREKSSIADNEKVIAQLDTAINAYMGKDKTDKALAVRKAQAPQRKQLRDEIDAAQKKVDGFDEEKLKLTSEVRALQLEVGPIKYIADLVYGKGGGESEKVESAVVLFTLLIVSTLDPLAVILLIAANHTLLRLQNEKKEKKETGSSAAHLDTVTSPADVAQKHTTEETEEASPLTSYSILDMANNGVQLQDTEMDAKLYEQDVVENRILNEEVAPLEIPQDASLVGGGSPAIDKEHVKGTKEEADIIVEDANMVGTAVLFKAEEEPVNEKEITAVERVADAGLSLPPPIILSPPVSRIGVTPRPIDTTLETEVYIQAEAPKITTHESTVLREMLGNQPHFIPQKINEEEKQNSMVGHATKANESPEDECETEITETMQEVEGSGPVKVQEADGITLVVHNGTNLPAKTDKYPISLSWLKEFKGN
jgi:hypothetical protein